MSRRRWRLAIVSVAAVAWLAACAGGDDAAPATSAASVPAATTVATATSDTGSPSATEPAATGREPTGPEPTEPAATQPPATAPAATEPTGAEYPPQPAGVPFPTVAWTVGDLPAGVDRGALDAAVDDAFGAPDNPKRARSILVVVGGEIVYERYHPLDPPEVTTSSFSVAKSFAATVIGLLDGDGRLDIDAPAPVAEWQGAGDRRAGITIDDLLRMSSGLAWAEEYSAASPVAAMFAAEHAADVPINEPLESEPGTVYEYSTGTSAILADIAADVLGGGDALDRYIHDRLLDPIGMTSSVLLEDRTGTWLGGLGVDSTTRDFARFGLLYLRDGVWDGERILPEGWVDAVRVPSETNPDYGLQWWLSGPPGTFEARGLGGQLIRVWPELDLVLVITATDDAVSNTLATEASAIFAAALR
jgi:CubicO group peptidase (beta-lactamase class C family)